MVFFNGNCDISRFNQEQSKAFLLVPKRFSKDETYLPLLLRLLFLRLPLFFKLQRSKNLM